MLSVYMRPWTLNPANATSPTPLLTNLSKVTQQPDNNGSATPPANILNAVPPVTRTHLLARPLARRLHDSMHNSHDTDQASF